MISMLNKFSAKKASGDLTELYRNVVSVCNGAAFKPPAPGRERKKLVTDTRVSKVLDQRPELKRNALKAISKLTGLPIVNELDSAGQHLKTAINEWQNHVADRIAKKESLDDIIASPETKLFKETIQPYIESAATKHQSMPTSEQGIALSGPRK